jgi:hypothetical protein
MKRGRRGREQRRLTGHVRATREVNKGWLLGVLLIGPFMAQADATIANVATPSIWQSAAGRAARRRWSGVGNPVQRADRSVTNAVPAEYAADISGVSTTTLQIGGAIAVAAFGTLHLSLTSHAGAGDRTHAFAVTTAGFAGVALLATVTAYRATRPVPPAALTSAVT